MSKIDKIFEAEVQKRIKEMDFIPVETIQNSIMCHLKSIEQWATMYNYERAFYWEQQVEALVALLEVHNCGSIGGFDVGQDFNHHYSLKERALFVCNKGK